MRVKREKYDQLNQSDLEPSPFFGADPTTICEKLLELKIAFSQIRLTSNKIYA